MIDVSEIATGPGETMGNAGPGMLNGVRVIEIAETISLESIGDAGKQ